MRDKSPKGIIPSSKYSIFAVVAMAVFSVGAVAQEKSTGRSVKPDLVITPSPLTDSEINFLNSGNQVVSSTGSVVEYPTYPSNIFEPMESGQISSLGVGPIELLVTVEPNLPSGASFEELSINAISRKAEVIEALSSNPSVTLLQNIEDLPILLIEIDGASVQSLESIDAIGAVELNQSVTADHTSTIPVINVRDLQLHGTNGAGFAGGGGGWSVAVLDTGLRTTHEAFTGRILSESCFVSDGSCPNGTNTMIGPGSASDCGAAGGRCSHGTHVSGTAVGEFTSPGLLSTDGVAPGAGLHAVQIFDANGHLAQFVDIVRALNHVNDLVLSGERIASVNMSLGTSTGYTGVCDFASPSTLLAASTLRNNGVMVIASAGNGFTSTQMGLPACLSSIVSVGNTRDDDSASSSSSASPAMDVWAPGTIVTSASDAGDRSLITFTGTSMSAPHVAGATALLRECFIRPGSSAASSSVDDTILNTLELTGVTVTDNRISGGVTKPRIDVGAAAKFLRRNDQFNLATRIGQSSGRYLGLNTCATAEAQEPGHLSGGDTTGSVWFDYQASTSGIYEFTTCDGRTSFDTVLAVYSGNSVGNLNLVAVNDDDFSCSNSRASTVSVPLIAGQSLKIAVSGFGIINEFGATGVYGLNWSSFPATCNGAQATILGTAGADVINGTNGDDVIVSFNGNDTINGLGGNDTICTGNGNDIVSGGDGDDYINGGNGNDDIKGQLGDDVILGSNGNDTLRGSRGNDTVNGGAGNDDINGGWGDDELLGGAGIDTMVGDIGNDVMYGQLNNDNLDGGEGDDVLFGGLGDDVMKGGPDNDILRGSAGDDTLRGSRGDDFLDGGAGNDSLNGGVHDVRDRCVSDVNDTIAECEVNL